MSKQLDFLAVGDVVVDAFIRLQDATVHCKINNEECEICMRWGDKIPFESATVVPAVGNSANAAVAAARLGLSSSLRAYVGDDADGQACIDSLHKDGLDTTLVEKVPGKKTNYHYVLWYESERTILVKHETFDYAVPTLEVPPKWLYLSSLGENSLPYHEAWLEQLAKWPETKLAFQPGTFHFKLGKDKLAAVYQRADIFFCNKEEAERILGIEPTEDIKGLLSQIQALGPKIVVITNDRKGAFALAEDGKAWFVPRYPDPRDPFERTGAGDAFASTVTAALALGKPLEEALLWGPTNAMSVVQKIGAQEGLQTRDQLEALLKDAPEDFKLSPL